MIDQFARQNRWWADPAAIDQDRHIRRLRQARRRWEGPLPFRVERDAVYTLRGPRQVGKSTILKRQIATLLADGWPARRLLYLDVELAGLETARDLVAAIREFLDVERSPLAGDQPRLAVFLDEVTRVRGWAGAVRGLVDNDELRGVMLVATGSHTADLRQGGERLPGRRGGGGELDLELLPLSFREYVGLVDPGLPLPPTIASFEPESLRRGRRDRDVARPRLAALLERYLMTGGFLSALNDEATHGAVLAETFEAYREAVAGEFTRAGLREAYLREVVDWLARHLGQELDYRGMAADTDIGSKDTARHYLDHMVETYTALLLYRASNLSAPTPGFRSPKKLLPLDPLFWHLIMAWAANDPDPWSSVVEAVARPEDVGHLVESVLLVHLRRAFGDRVFYWRERDRELDVVVAPPGAGGRGASEQAMLGEVKYQRQIDAADARVLASMGGGTLVTRTFEGDLAGGAVHALPAAVALVLLDAPALAPIRRQRAC